MYAEAKGLKPWDIMTRYALRNAMLPQAMGLALTLGFMMSGQLLIEILFVYPGHRRADDPRHSRSLTSTP